MNRTYLFQALRFGLNRVQVRDLEPLLFSNGSKLMVIAPLRNECPNAPAIEYKQGPSQPETRPVAPPSAPEGETQTEERTKRVSTTPIAAPERANTRAAAANNGHEAAAEDAASFKAVLDHIDSIKSNLRTAISDLCDAVAMLKNAERQQRASAKEMQLFRAKLREIQRVDL